MNSFRLPCCKLHATLRTLLVRVRNLGEALTWSLCPVLAGTAVRHGCRGKDRGGTCCYGHPVDLHQRLGCCASYGDAGHCPRRGQGRGGRRSRVVARPACPADNVGGGASCGEPTHGRRRRHGVGWHGRQRGKFWRSAPARRARARRWAPTREPTDAAARRTPRGEAWRLREHGSDDGGPA
jgi:hypothetical protein